MNTSSIRAVFGRFKRAALAPSIPAAKFVLLLPLLLLSAQAREAFAQTATSSVFPANPTYVDAVTGIVTIPAVAGQAPVTGMIDYSIDGGTAATATVSTGTNYVNLGQLTIGSHVLTFQPHPQSPSGSPITPPPPVSIPVTDQGFGFVGVYGRFHSNYTDANLFSSAGIAIDSKDTVWIADSILSKLVSFDVFGNINNVAIASLPFPIANPAGLAFDSSDNLFIADHGNSRIIKYTPAGVETVLPISGLGKPGELMLDKVRNLLYIVDQDNERVLRYDLSAMALAGSSFTNLTAIQSIALDPAGNVYVSDKLAGFLENVNGAVSGLAVHAPIQTPGGIFVDRAGLLYLTDSSINGTYRIDAQGHQTQISDFDSSFGMAEDSRGRIYFGPSTNVRTFTPAGELGVVAATTSIFGNSDQNNALVYTMPQGQTSLTQVVSPSPTFVYDVNTESCPYVQIRGTCYFDVNFQPKVPGVHQGTIATTLPGGPTINTLLYGSAVGPAPAFSPGTQTQTPSGALLSENVALDEAGNYYVSDAAGNQVYETSGGVTRPLGFTGLSFPNALAVDGADAVYVQDSGNNRIAKLDPAGNQTFPVAAGAGNALSELDTFAMDGGGQIYFAGPASSGTSIYLYDRTGATSLIASGLAESAALALDPYGDIYSLQVNGSLLRIDTYGRQSTLSPAGTFQNHTALAVDASETAYVAQSGVAAITLVHPNGTTESVPVPALSHVGGIAINGTGSILAVDSETNNFTFVDRTHQDFNFGNVPVNTTTTFSAFFGNAGSEPFQIITLPGDSDFQQVTTADACSTTGANATVAAGSSCDLSYTVAPTSLGTITATSRITTSASVDFDTFTENAVRVPTAPTFVPASVSFGSVDVGGTAEQTITLMNNDTSPLALGGISVGGSFSVTGASTCVQNGTIAVGGSCSLTVQFAPTATGVASSALTVQYTGGSAAASLTGTGIAPPAATAAPTSLDFGTVPVGATSAAQTLTITNPAMFPLTLTSVAVNGSGFSIQSAGTTCKTGPAIAAGASCTFSVIFSPGVAGAVSGSLTIGLPPGFAVSSLTVPLTGTGAPPVTVIDFSTGFTTSALTLNGPAAISGGALQLTSGQSAAASSAFFPNPAVTSTFATDFTFQLLDPATEGITFTIQGDGPAAVGSNGGGLGYQGIPNSIALKFDLRDTAGEGDDSTGIYVDGAAPTVPATSLADSGIDLHSGDLFALHIAYDGTTEFITLTDTVTNASWTTQAAEDIPSIVGGGSAYFGFTAGTGAVSADAVTANSQAKSQAKSQTKSQIRSLPGASAKPAEAAATAASASAASIVSWTYNTVITPATLAPTALNFGSVTVGSTSAVQVAELVNTGTAQFQVASITPSDPAIVVHSSYCARPVTPGTYCKLEVTLAPSAGPFSGTVVINYYLGDGTLPGENLTSTLTVTGAGVVPSVTLTPASADFGSVLGNATSSPQTFTVTNNSASAVTITRVTIADDPSLPFQIASGATCISGGQLPAGQSCTVPIVFAPTATSGATSGALYISYLDTYGDAVTLTSSLTGTGMVPLLTVTPASLNFGNVGIGATSATQTVTLTNVSNQAILAGFSDSDSGTFPYSGCNNAFGSEVLSPGQSCVLSLNFHPTALSSGAATGTLRIGYSAYDGTEGTLTVSLTGTAQPQPPPTVTPANLNFGSVAIGSSSANQTATFTNVSSVPVLASLDFFQSFLDNYSVSGCDNFLGIGELLMPGASCILSFQFHPTGSGENTEAVDLIYTQNSNTAFATTGTLTLSLTGTGVAPASETPFVNLGTGFTADALTLTGPVNVAGGALELTSGPSSAASSAFYPTPVPTSSFTTEFTFQLLDPTAEGITFTIQGDGPNAVGLGGGGLGYQGLAKSIAVKFDLKDTAGEGVDSTGIYVDGAAPTVPAVSLASSGIDLHSGDTFDLRLSYDGTTMTVNLTDTVTNAVWSTQAAEDIPGITGGSTAYFGFTAGSGTPTLTSDAAEARPASITAIAAKTARAARPAAVAADATPAPATSNILSWIYVANGETKAAQTITFPHLNGTAYGCAPVTLAATASSGLPISYSVSGPAKLSGTMLTVTGPGEVTVTATQPGNASFAAATPVAESFAVARRTLTVTANSFTRTVGIANAPLTYSLSGFVDGDTASVIGGTALLTTAAAANSPAGSYPITFYGEGLTAANYNFNYVAGTMTVVPASCQTINYSSGFSAGGLSLNNGATVANSQLQLTDGGVGEARSAFFTTPMPISSYTTDFTVQLLNPVSDGMTFVIQSNSPKEYGEGGGGLGYAGIPNSMAFKLDLHNNSGEGADSTGMYLNGAYPSTPAVNLAPYAIDLHSGHIFKVHLAFSGTNTAWMITDTVTGASASGNVPGDITQTVGSSAYIGFGAGTGGGTATQSVLAWSFSGGTGCGAR